MCGIATGRASVLRSPLALLALVEVDAQGPLCARRRCLWRWDLEVHIDFSHVHVWKAVVEIGGGGSTSCNDTQRNALAPLGCIGPWRCCRPRGGAAFRVLVVHIGAPRAVRGR